MDQDIVTIKNLRLIKQFLNDLLFNVDHLIDNATWYFCSTNLLPISWLRWLSVIGVSLKRMNNDNNEIKIQNYSILLHNKYLAHIVSPTHKPNYLSTKQVCVVITWHDYDQKCMTKSMARHKAQVNDTIFVRNCILMRIHIIIITKLCWCGGLDYYNLLPLMD